MAYSRFNGDEIKVPIRYSGTIIIPLLVKNVFNTSIKKKGKKL